MKQTLMLKLAPDAGQRAALLATMEAVNAACDYMAVWAAEHGTTSKWTIQAGCYRDVRDRYGLSAQATVRAIAKVAAAQKVSKSKAATFRPHGAIAYDSRIMSFKSLEHVSLLTTTGRILVPMRLGNYQRARMEAQRGEADLIFRDGRFYLSVTLDVPEPEQFEPVGTLGVDLGIVNLAADSDGDTHSGARIEECRSRYAERRAILQGVGTRSARRRLAKTRRSEARFRADANHIVSKQIVEKAQRTKRQIAVEELTGIRARIRARRPQRSRQAGWAFAQLRAFIEYKALLAGVPVIAVDPRNTSRTCPECEHCEKANRRTRDEFVCRSCGHAAPADINAARNIASRAAVMQPMVRGGLSCAAA
jgi:putative transposase